MLFQCKATAIPKEAARSAQAAEAASLEPEADAEAEAEADDDEGNAGRCTWDLRDVPQEH